MRKKKVESGEDEAKVTRKFSMRFSMAAAEDEEEREKLLEWVT